MKKKTIVLFFLFFSFFSSCSNENNNPSEPQYLISIGSFKVFIDLMQSGVAISSRDSVTDCIFKLNGINIAVSWEYSESLDEWDTYTIYKDLPDSLEFKTGKSYDVYLKLNGTEYMCTVKLSDKPKVTWPKFDTNSNYTFTWNLIDIPTEQTIYMYVSDDNKHKERYWHLDGKARSHTIDKSYFKGFDETAIDLDIDIYCFNYYQDGDFIVLAETWTNISDTENLLHRQMKNKRLLNAFHARDVY